MMDDFSLSSIAVLSFVFDGSFLFFILHSKTIGSIPAGAGNGKKKTKEKV
jgi:hypothetical protein